MRFAFFFLLALVSLWSSAQWQPLDIPTTTRYDDVFFVDALTGWAVGGGARTIYKTTDGGNTWTLKYTTTGYTRSIEFLTPQLGFAGTLSGDLFKTTDAGETWTNITSSLPRAVPGICGMAAPSATIIYACGRWAGSDPPYVMKSSDGGQNWTVKDMSEWASHLVDMFFLNENEGFVTGMANPRSDGGIILKTTDGGANWEVIHKTEVDRYNVWKIQTPDSVHFVASIESLPAAGNVRFIKSTDAGENWEIKIVDASKWNYIQMIGFKDALTGWTGGTANGGGETVLYQTIDGGENWTLALLGSGSTFNRFFMFNAETIFLTGRQVYKYNPEYIPTGTQPINIFHNLHVYPNPTHRPLIMNVQMANTSTASLQLFDASGKLIKTFFEGELAGGEHQFEFNLPTTGSTVLFLCLHTNEGLFYSKIVRK